MSGCAAEKKHTAAVPGCINAHVQVDPGCYKVEIEGGIEVRCPHSTVRYRCTNHK